MYNDLNKLYSLEMVFWNTFYKTLHPCNNMNAEILQSNVKPTTRVAE